MLALRGYDAALLEILAARGCCIGFTTHVGVADLAAFPEPALLRIDTNDLQKQAAGVGVRLPT